MLEMNTCRLCLTTEDDQLYLNVFSESAIELKLKDIINEHFKCDITEDDSLPNYVCQMCWSTTEAFHELYQKSKLIQEKYLNEAIKMELDTESYQASSDESFWDDNGPDLTELKAEPKLEKKLNDVKLTKLFSERQIQTEYIKCNCKPNVGVTYASSGKILNCHLDHAKYTSTVCDRVCVGEGCVSSHMENPLALDSEDTLEPQCFVCDICNDEFMSKSHLVTHLHGHISKQSQSSKEEMYRAFMADNFDMSCQYCSKIFISVIDARRHYRGFHNTNRGHIKCCNKKFYTEPQANGHIAAHLNPDHFKCDLCGKSFMAKTYLMKHKDSHKAKVERKFVCDYCGKTFPNKESLKVHLLRMHVTSKPKFECNICQKGFQIESHLNAHLNTIHVEHPPLFTCDVCGKSYKRKQVFEMHVAREHSGEKFGRECEYCGEWLATPGKIFYHKQKHESGIQKCDHCQKEYPNKVSLQSHIARQHGELKYNCSYCDRSFSMIAAKKSHEETHTRHNVYPCKFCTKVFNVYKSRDTHCRRHHAYEHKMSVKK